MPKAAVKPKEPIERLSILDEKGKLDKKREPKIAKKTLHAMHEAMLRARLFDERLLNLQRQGKLGTFAPVKGQEACQVGSVAPMKSDDWIVPSFRENAVALWRGLQMDGIFLFIAGYNEGLAIPEGQNDMPVAVPVASQLPHAVGIAYANKLKKKKNVVLAYFGDGATSEGDFHEALNMAGVLEVPAIFICQNNQWAISVPREKQTKAHTIAQKAAAYGIPGVQVDGNDILAVYAATKEAVARARKDNQPTLIECVTYRMEVHTTADDPTVYRDDKEVEKWAARDPIERFEGYLKNKDLLADKDIEKLSKKLNDEIDDAWEKTQKTIEGLDDPLVIFDHMFEEETKGLSVQRKVFKELVEAGQQKAKAEPEEKEKKKQSKDEQDSAKRGGDDE